MPLFTPEVFYSLAKPQKCFILLKAAGTLMSPSILLTSANNSSNFANEAVTLLRSRGFAVRRLDVGVPEWRRLGLPVTIEEKEVTI